MGRISKDIIGFVFAFLLLSSCGIKKKVSSTEKDTKTIVKERVEVRDTIITTDASSSEIKVLLKDLLDGQERMAKSGNSVSKVRYNTITKEVEADCDCLEMDVLLPLIKKIIESNTKTTINTKEQVTKTSFWDKINFGIAGALMVGIALLSFLIKKVI